MSEFIEIGEFVKFLDSTAGESIPTAKPISQHNSKNALKILVTLVAVSFTIYLILEYFKNREVGKQ